MFFVIFDNIFGIHHATCGEKYSLQFLIVLNINIEMFVTDVFLNIFGMFNTKNSKELTIV